MHTLCIIGTIFCIVTRIINILIRIEVPLFWPMIIIIIIDSHFHSKNITSIMIHNFQGSIMVLKIIVGIIPTTYFLALSSRIVKLIIMEITINRL